MGWIRDPEETYPVSRSSGQKALWSRIRIRNTGRSNSRKCEPTLYVFLICCCIFFLSRSFWASSSADTPPWNIHQLPIPALKGLSHETPRRNLSYFLLLYSQKAYRFLCTISWETGTVIVTVSHYCKLHIFFLLYIQKTSSTRNQCVKIWTFSTRTIQGLGQLYLTFEYSALGCI